jgi:hypothetical protein
MLIAKIEDSGITVADYRDMFPKTSFPSSGPTAEFLAENNCKPVNVFKSYDRNAEKLVACDPYVEGEWVYTINVAPLTEEELIAVRDNAASQVRAERNAKLSASDWTQVLDAPVNQTVWSTYRQELRDITKQDGFPWDITWPDAP